MMRQLLALTALATLAVLAHGRAAEAFDDARSRHAFFPLAAAAYSDEPLKCLHSRYGANVEMIGSYKVPCDKRDSCFAFVALAHDEKAILIGYRGSSSALQLIYEGAGSILHSHVKMFGITQVSEYFYNAWNVTWTGTMEHAVHELLTTPKYDDYEIRISGHSLGGAMASIAATWIANEYPKDRPRIHFISYGCPRIGDFAYSLYHNNLVASSFRVTHHRDLVPAIPPLSFQYFYHAKREVFYEDGMAAGAHYTECASGETLGCLLGKLGTSIEDHLHYYETSVSGYGAHCATAV